LCTGTNSLRLSAALAAAWLLLATGASQAQVLKLSSLKLPQDVAAGSWVAYQVNVSSKNRPPRRFTQRLSVVSREGTGTEAGAWVELKTIEDGKVRMERGYFIMPEAGRDFADSSFYDEGGEDAPPDEAPAATTAAPTAPLRPIGLVSPKRLKLARYQRLTPEGKLYEYPVDEEGAPLADEDVSAMDMLEFVGKADRDTLPPDTLRAGRKVIPCRVRRISRASAQNWEGDDSTYVNRAVMTRTYWRNPWVPVLGYARLVVEVSTVRVPTGSPAPPDSAAHGAAAAAPPDTARAGRPSSPPQQAGPVGFYRAEAMVVDMGQDAVPEVTQAAEPAPQESTPRPRIVK
jgi:hypothetical protein